MEHFSYSSMKHIVARLIHTNPPRLLARRIIAGLVVLVAALGLYQAASADQTAFAINPLHSPIKRAIIVKVTCSRNANPVCVPIALSTIRARVTTHFYIDGVERGRANRLYRRVCSTFNLGTGYHSARVYATDSRGNKADTVDVANIIRCR